jgi:hypothetical protein
VQAPEFAAGYVHATAVLCVQDEPEAQLLTHVAETAATSSNISMGTSIQAAVDASGDLQLWRMCSSSSSIHHQQRVVVNVITVAGMLLALSTETVGVACSATAGSKALPGPHLTLSASKVGAAASNCSLRGNPCWLVHTIIAN